MGGNHERRERLLDVMRQERFQWLTPEDQYWTILSHFRINNERNVADAIEYGLETERHCSDCSEEYLVIGSKH